MKFDFPADRRNTQLSHWIVAILLLVCFACLAKDGDDEAQDLRDAESKRDEAKALGITGPTAVFPIAGSPYHLLQYAPNVWAISKAQVEDPTHFSKAEVIDAQVMEDMAASLAPFYSRKDILYFIGDGAPGDVMSLNGDQIAAVLRDHGVEFKKFGASVLVACHGGELTETKGPSVGSDFSRASGLPVVAAMNSIIQSTFSAEAFGHPLEALSLSVAGFDPDKHPWHLFLPPGQKRKGPRYRMALAMGKFLNEWHRTGFVAVKTDAAPNTFPPYLILTNRGPAPYCSRILSYLEQGFPAPTRRH